MPRGFENSIYPIKVQETITNPFDGINSLYFRCASVGGCKGKQGIRGRFYRKIFDVYNRTKFFELCAMYRYLDFVKITSLTTIYKSLRYVLKRS